MSKFQVEATIYSIHGVPILIDAEDYELLSNYRWHVGSHGYAANSAMGDKCSTCNMTKKHSLLMHRIVMGEPQGERKYVDHINRNRLDNRKINLRWVTHAKNMTNQGVRSDSQSGVRGVTWDKSRGKWFVCIRQNGKTIALGRYDDFATAEQVWLDKAKELKYV